MDLPDFSTMTNDLFDLQGKYDMDVTPHDGYLTVNIYVGIENTDLFKMAQKMFEPVD
jgi:hypothetical protein